MNGSFAYNHTRKDNNVTEKITVTARKGNNKGVRQSTNQHTIEGPLEISIKMK